MAHPRVVPAPDTYVVLPHLQVDGALPPRAPGVFHVDRSLRPRYNRSCFGPVVFWDSTPSLFLKGRTVILVRERTTRSNSIDCGLHVQIPGQCFARGFPPPLTVVVLKQALAQSDVRTTAEL